MSYLNPKTDIEMYREQCKNSIITTTLPAEYETCRGDKLEIVEDITTQNSYMGIKTRFDWRYTNERFRFQNMEW